MRIKNLLSLKAEYFLIAALALALAAILGAWIFEVVGGYVPCALCLQQRTPYYIGIPFIIFSWSTARRSPRLAFMAALLGALFFYYGAGLGIYQAGAEWKWWLGPTDCGGNAGALPSAGNLLDAMQATRLVSCTDPALRIFGLSFAGWNAVVSFMVAGLSSAAALRLWRFFLRASTIS